MITDTQISDIMKKIDDGQYIVHVNEDSFKSFVIDTTDGDVEPLDEEILYWNSYMYWYEKNRKYWTENFISTEDPPLVL